MARLGGGPNQKPLVNYDSIRQEQNPYAVRPKDMPVDPTSISPYEMQRTNKKDRYGDFIYEPKRSKNVVGVEDGTLQMSPDFQWQDRKDMQWSEDYGAKAGTIQDHFANLSAQDADFTAQNQGMDRMWDVATQAGPSEWAGLQEQRQRLGELDARERADRDMMGQLAGARSQLAMRGGLGSGARERMALGGQRNLNQSRQDIARQGRMARLGIGVQDQERKDKMLGMYQRGEISANQLQAGLAESDADRQLRAATDKATGQFKTSAAQVDADLDAAKFTSGAKMGFDVGEKDRQTAEDRKKLGWKYGVSQDYNKAEMDKWRDKMGAWGAEKTGQAIQNSGPGGNPGFLSNVISTVI